MVVERADIPSREERAAAYLAADDAANRDARRTMLIGAGLCFAWLLVGLYIFGWSMHVNDQATGMVFFWAGLLVGNAGILLTVAWVVRRMTARGDFGS